MRLTIFAATGGIGRQLLQQALAAGHDVTVVVRNPDKLSENVKTVRADLENPDPLLLKSAVIGADAVLSALGPTRRAEDGVTSRGTQAIVSAMTAAGARRLVIVSVAGIMTMPSPSRPNPPKRDPGQSRAVRWILSPIAKLFLGRHYADVALTEDLLRNSGLDWTAVRVPLLTDKPRTGHYRTAIEQSVPGGSRIARADAADLMLRVIDERETIGVGICVAY
jgi:putative NADH-flavin reductase